ncbi:hypothetical protein BWR15_08835 [Pseudomonas sp. T]|nr:hypothetical protein BWR15_08835 [Pseudomonas sp. T]
MVWSVAIPIDIREPRAAWVSQAPPILRKCFPVEAGHARDHAHGPLMQIGSVRAGAAGIMDY